MGIVDYWDIYWDYDIRNISILTQRFQDVSLVHRLVIQPQTLQCRVVDAKMCQALPPNTVPRRIRSWQPHLRGAPELAWPQHWQRLRCQACGSPGVKLFESPSLEGTLGQHIYNWHHRKRSKTFKDHNKKARKWVSQILLWWHDLPSCSHILARPAQACGSASWSRSFLCSSKEQGIGFVTTKMIWDTHWIDGLTRNLNPQIVILRRESLIRSPAVHFRSAQLQQIKYFSDLSGCAWGSAILNLTLKPPSAKPCQIMFMYLQVYNILVIVRQVNFF